MTSFPGSADLQKSPEEKLEESVKDLSQFLIESVQLDAQTKHYRFQVLLAEENLTLEDLFGVLDDSGDIFNELRWHFRRSRDEVYDFFTQIEEKLRSIYTLLGADSEIGYRIDIILDELEGLPYITRAEERYRRSLEAEDNNKEG